MTLCLTSTSGSPGEILDSGSRSPAWVWAPCTSTGGWWTGSGSPTPCSPTPGPPASTQSLSQTGPNCQALILNPEILWTTHPKTKTVPIMVESKFRQEQRMEFHIPVPPLWESQPIQVNPNMSWTISEFW